MATSRCWACGLLILAVASLAACDRARSRPDPVVDVHVAGWESDGYVQRAKVWNKGVARPLSDSPSIATAIAATGDDVLVAGCVHEASRSVVVATLWRNGVAEALTDGTGGDACAEGIAVSGADVYVVGYEGQAAMIWKNGVGRVLANTGILNCTGRAVSVSGSDVYVAGYTYETTEIVPTFFLTTTVARLWKNGAAVALSDGRSGAAALGLAVDGSDIYVAGYVALPCTAPCSSQRMATVWRNGAGAAVTEHLGASAIGIAVAGGRVYAAGAQSNGTIDVAVLWTDGVPTLLGDPSHFGHANAVAVAGGDVYVAGQEDGHARFWKNGAPTGSIDWLVEGEALAIAAVPR